MNALQLISALSVDFTFDTLLHEHSAFLIIGILVLFASIVMGAARFVIIQTIALTLFFVTVETFSNPTYLVLVVLQVGFGVWMIWKVKTVIDTSYYRHSEKTHKRPRDITRGGNAGTGHVLY
ncbi:hypothetical protein A1A1_09816 [Planococcus antarcticus DSM 14505]|uniref:Uncharacterized protein n=1 Tax=Planococcus antarcticus DSM 14505 TaxID=1185653 RepID=A0A1C7DH44_9BACL|nr:hypothetical protein [Planococcus antarcticus]ANU10738.1 hypothetical protein BBH88_10685 [Planococcus antarcticus DSM 14505]EIM06833.1 hypothetical protein A1A1_09816 [Planococcus antarcticus DSM 14505]